MKLIHTSPEEIKEISDSGMFGDCLFFSTHEYAMGNVKAVYSLEIDEEKIIYVSSLDDEELVAHIAQVLEVDEDAAERILDGRDTVFDHGKDAEYDWWIQAKQGECAKKMGFEACESQDEQGTVFIVPMLNRENELKREA